MNCKKPLVTGSLCHKFAPVLSSREKEVLILVTRGLTNKEIARKIGTSIIHIKGIIHEICSKLGAESRVEAILLAVMGGLLKGEEVFSIDELAWFISLSPQAERTTAQLLGLKPEQMNLRRHKEGASRMAGRPTATLTNRQREILGLVARGLTNKEISDQICISTNTVKSSLSHAYTKLRAHSRMQATTAAMKGRSLALDDAFLPNELEKLLFSLGPVTHNMIARMISEGRAQSCILAGTKRSLRRSGTN